MQAKLVDDVSAMLNSFAARKAAEVAAAVGGMQASLAEGRTDVTAKLGILSQATQSAESALQVGSIMSPLHLSKILELINDKFGWLRICLWSGVPVYGNQALIPQECNAEMTENVLQRGHLIPSFCFYMITFKQLWFLSDVQGCNYRCLDLKNAIHDSFQVK